METNSLVMSLLLHRPMEVPIFSNEVHEEKTDCDSDSVETQRKCRDSLLSSKEKSHDSCSVDELSPNRFAAYVKCLSFDDVADTVSRECIDAKCFLSMDNDDLRDLGVDADAVSSIKTSLRKHKQPPLQTSLSLPLPPSSKPLENDRIIYGRLVVLGYKVLLVSLLCNNLIVIIKEYRLANGKAQQPVGPPNEIFDLIQRHSILLWYT